MAASKQRGKAIQFQIGWAGLIAIVVSCVCVLLWTFVLGFWMGQKVATGNSKAPKVSVYSPTAKATSPTESSMHQGGQNGMLIGPREDEVAKKELSAIKENLKEEASQEGIKTEVLPGAASEAAKEEKTPAGEVSKKKQTVSQEEGVKEQAEKKAHVQENVKGTKKAAKKVKSTHKIKTEKIARPAKEVSRPFALQIASYRTLTQAKKEAQRWRKKGYFVRIKSANLGRKGIWYRVYLGRYRSLEEAKKASVRLATKEGLRSYVTKVSK